MTQMTTTTRVQDIDRHVGARIRESRIMLGLTQQQLADLIGVTYQQAHKYERGINRVSAGRLYQIARALSVPVGSFFEGLEEPQSRSTWLARAHVPGACQEFRADPERALSGSPEPARPGARHRALRRRESGFLRRALEVPSSWGARGVEIAGRRL